MIPRGTSRLLSRGGIVFDPVNTSNPTSQTLLLPNPHPLGWVHEAATAETWRRIRPHVVGITRLHPSGRCGGTRVGGYFQTHLFPNALENGRMESTSLSPPHSQKGLFQLGRKWLHMLSRSGSQALIFGSARRSREATRLSSSSQGRMKPRLQPDTRRGTSHARPPRPSRDAH